MEHVDWRINAIAEEDKIRALVVNAHKEGLGACQRFSKYLSYLSSYSDDEEILDYPQDEGSLRRHPS